MQQNKLALFHSAQPGTVSEKSDLRTFCMCNAHCNTCCNRTNSLCFISCSLIQCLSQICSHVSLQHILQHTMQQNKLVLFHSVEPGTVSVNLDLWLFSMCNTYCNTHCNTNCNTQCNRTNLPCFILPSLVQCLEKKSQICGHFVGATPTTTRAAIHIAALIATVQCLRRKICIHVLGYNFHTLVHHQIF